MSNPFQEFEVELPAGVDPSVLATLEQEVARTEGVDQCGVSTPRSIDAASLTIWITLVGTLVTTLDKSVPVIQKIVELFRQKGIRGAKFILADGSTLEADSISAEDLLKLTKKE